MTLAARSCAPLLLGLLLGCRGKWETITYEDEGTLCFQQLDAEIVVTVTAPECLSSSCSRDLDGACTATVDGATIEVTSEITWEQNEGPFANCTDDCGSPSIQCSLGELSAGSYTVVHGEDEVALVVPVEGGGCPF